MPSDYHKFSKSFVTIQFLQCSMVTLLWNEDWALWIKFSPILFSLIRDGYITANKVNNWKIKSITSIKLFQLWSSKSFRDVLNFEFLLIKQFWHNFSTFSASPSHSPCSSGTDIAKKSELYSSPSSQQCATNRHVK